MQVGGKSFRETRGKYCFHTSHDYTVELVSSEYHKSQRSKWLKNVIDHFFEQRPGLWLLMEGHSLLALFFTVFPLNICYWPLWDTVLDWSLAWSLMEVMIKETFQARKKMSVNWFQHHSIFSQDTDNPPRYKQMKKSFLFIFKTWS